MKKQILLIAGVILIITSCSKTNDGGLPKGTSENAGISQGPITRPFSGAVVYRLDNTISVPCNCAPYATAGPFLGTGDLSHMGASTSKASVCYAPIIANSVLAGYHVASQCFSFVGANGDELYLSTHSYDIMLDTYGIGQGAGNVDIIGGTGRFANATGGFTGTVKDSLQGTIYMNFVGTITY